MMTYKPPSHKERIANEKGIEKDPDPLRCEKCGISIGPVFNWFVENYPDYFTTKEALKISVG